MAMRHYVPKVYLRNFLEKGRFNLAVLNKQTGKIYYPQLKYLCSEADFFDLDGIDDSLNLRLKTDNNIKFTSSLLEDLLSTYETELGVILPQMISDQCFGYYQDNLFLIDWLAWLYIANPVGKAFLKNRISECSNTILCGGFINWHKRLVPFFRAKRWFFVKGETARFLACDCPVVLIPKPKDVLDYQTLADSTILCPLSSSCALVGIPNKYRKIDFDKSRILEDRKIFELDIYICRNAQNYVMASNESFISNFLKEVNEDMQEKGF